MIIYTDMVYNSVVGDIYIYWGSDFLLRSVYCKPNHLDPVAVHGDLKSVNPGVYEYVANVGRGIMENLDMDNFYLDEFTPFFKDVYKALLTIPYGSTITYKELAEKAGYPNAYRAVGTAMSKNPFLYAIPCHRVVGVNSLGGFAAGLDIKLKLMQAEGAYPVES